MDSKEVQQLMNQVADETFDSFAENSIVQIVVKDEKTGDPLVWVIPEVLSAEQCDSLIKKAEAAGMAPAVWASGSLRTSKRTSKYVDEDLSDLAMLQLSPDFINKLQESDGLSVNGLHSNWRIVRYDPGDYFCPHYDQSDITKPMNVDGSKDFYFSSHTLIINLTSNMADLKGGATRFYPNRDYSKAIDVSVPRGWAIAFKQQGMLHAGHQVISGTKYVAQAGLMRLLPIGQVHKPSAFRVGPGLDEAVIRHMEKLKSEKKMSMSQDRGKGKSIFL